MTIEKAIEILETLNDVENWPLEVHEGAALHLGIEALKREKEYRVILNGKHQQLLPGETEE